MKKSRLMELANVTITEGGGDTSWIKDPQVRSKVDMVIKTLGSLTGPGETVDGETMQFILEAIGMEEQMLKQLKGQEGAYGKMMREYTSNTNTPFFKELVSRMEGMADVSQHKKMIDALDKLLDGWYAEGFDRGDILNYFNAIVPEGPND